MSGSGLAVAQATILDALAHQSRISFTGVVVDVEQHVVPTMAAIAHSLVVIAGRLADGTYTKDIADVEMGAQIDAAASVIVRFANRILKEVEDIINAVLAAVRQVVNGALKAALPGIPDLL
ncbi:MAG TPA: hypothetical protein VLI93_15100 [Acetobacteraceae bacterium]|nr:hypothetical protein [Acetobacteraceae bacterium]